jgi:hypothetical protein
LGGALKIPLAMTTRLEIGYEYYVRFFDERRAKDENGNSSGSNPTQPAKEYQELEFEASARYRFTDQLSLRFDLEQEDVQSSDPRGEYDRLRTSLSVYWEF